jgi:hypothetical protein
MDFWVPGVEVAGVHEMVGNALVMKGEKRSGDFRGQPFKNAKEEEVAEHV